MFRLRLFGPLALLGTGMILGQGHVAAPGQPQEARSAGASYILGPDDSFSIVAVETEEISGKTFHIDDSGYASIPLAGRIRAGGLTVDQFEIELRQRLQKFIKNPEVSVTVTEFHSQPVSVLGAVASPGLQQLRGPRKLLDVIALAGGVRPDAGANAKITREREQGPIPVRNATIDSGGKFYTADIRLTAVTGGGDPEANIIILPHDVISVEFADKVYAIGEVARPGEFLVKDGALSLLQVLSMAGGINKDAAAQKAMILRPVLDGPKRASLPVDIQQVMSGQASDLPIMAGDILFVPSVSNTGRHAVIKTLEAVARYGPSILVYGLIH
jgi:polysaccharide export outer membrane protein